jgi:hypothetical protein
MHDQGHPLPASTLNQELAKNVRIGQHNLLFSKHAPAIEWPYSDIEKTGWFDASGPPRLFVYMGAVTQVKNRSRKGQVWVNSRESTERCVPQQQPNDLVLDLLDISLRTPDRVV